MCFTLAGKVVAMKFRTTIARTGKNTTGIEVPPAVLDELGAGKRPPVAVTVNGYTYRTTVGQMDGVPMISLSAANRAAAGVEGGDEVDVEVSLDTAPRTVEVPADFAAALDAEPAARATFDALSNSNKSWHVLQITGAKTEETRQRRIAKQVSSLGEGKPR